MFLLVWKNGIPRIMASVDVLTHTRVTPEPAALVLMKAMAIGKPIVTSSTSGTQELVSDNITNILVLPRDSQALVRGILYLFKNPKKATEMGLNDRRKVKDDFTLEK